MAEKFNIDADEVKFEGFAREFLSPEFREFKNILGANWMISVNFYDPLQSLWKNVLDTKKFRIRNRHARVIIVGNNISRKVLVRGKIVFLRHASKIVERTFENVFEEGESFYRFEVKSETAQEIASDCTLHCNLNFYVTVENYFYFKFKQDIVDFKQEIDSNQLQGANDLSNDFKVLFQNQDLSDVSIRCGEKIFKVHKVILSSRSQIFYAMFHNDMKENKENVVDINDMDPEILESMLEYIYCGKVATLDDSVAGKLLSAAEKYQLPGMKKACVTYLKCAISKDNVLSALTLGDLYDESLKKRAIEFVCLEFDHLQDSVEWNTFQKERAILANEVLHNIIKFANSEGKKAKD